MRVLLVADGDTKYGAPHSLCQMALALKKKYKIQLTVVLPKHSELVPKLLNNGINVYCVRYSPFYLSYPDAGWKFPIKYIIKGIEYYYGCFTAISSLEKKLDINYFDLIHANSSREDFAAAISSKYKKPLVWHIREFGDIDYHCYSYKKNYIECMNQNASALLAVSESVKQHWIKKGISREKIVRVYNGVKNNDYYISNKRRKNQSKYIKMIMVGGIQKTKGQEYAIKVIGRLLQSGIDARLDIIGDGSSKYIGYLKRIVSQYHLESKITFCGYQNNIEKVLIDYDIGLMCSRNEGFGRVTAEYMMAGLAVLASDSGANPELIREGIDGMLYAYGDIEDMEKKLKYIINNIDLMGGEDTHIYAQENFLDIVNAENVYNIYQKVLLQK